MTRHLVMSLLMCHNLALAQAQENIPEPKTSGGLGGLFSSISNGFSGILNPGPKKAFLATLTPGSYVPSPVALEISQDVESKRIDHLGLVPLPAYQDYANRVYDRLKAVSGIAGLPGSVYLLAIPELKASSTAAGNVFLSVAWMRTLGSDDELAALLAHELSHVLLHHHDTTVFSTTQKQAQFLFSSVAKVKNQLEKANANGATAQLTPGQAKHVRQIEKMAELTDTVALPAWTRGQELDADRLAADLLIAAGYSINGLTEFLDHVAAWESEQQKRRAALDAETEQSMAALALQGRSDDLIKEGMKSIVGRIKGVLASEHDVAEKRREELSAYLEQFHPDLPRRVMGKASYQTLLASNTVKPVVDGYERTFDAMVQLQDGRTAEALPTLTALTRPGGPLARHALPNFHLYKALRASGRAAEARKQLERTITLAEPGWQPYEEAMREVVRDGKRERALEIASNARKHFKNAPALTPQLVGIYTELGFSEQAQQSLVSCNLEHVNYRELCKMRSVKQ